MKLTIKSPAVGYRSSYIGTEASLCRSGFTLFERISDQLRRYVPHLSGKSQLILLSGSTNEGDSFSTRTSIYNTLYKYNLPNEGTVNYSQIINSVNEGVTLFFRSLSANEIDRILDYSIAPTGKCLEQTLRYTALWYLMLNMLIPSNTINYFTLL